MCYHQQHQSTKITLFRLLVEKLPKEGLQYHWTWAYNHIGYDHLNEGVAVLSRQPLTASEILSSDVDDPTDYHTRRVAVAKTTVDGREVTLLVSIFHGGIKVSKKSGHALRNVSNLLANLLS